MRLVSLALAALPLALAGCGEKEAAGNSAAVDQAVTAENFSTNDTTAIDAATGADANMAADVDINYTGSDPDNGSGAATMTRPPARRAPRPSQGNSAATANETTPAATEPTLQPVETNSD